MLKVGDHVKVLVNPCGQGSLTGEPYIGDTGVITRVKECEEGIEYGVRHDLDSIRLTYSEGEIELLKSRYFAPVTGYSPVLPKRATKRSAGYDICVLENYTLNPGEKKIFPTGLKAYMPDDEVLMIYPRSSLGSKGLVLANTTAIIDADYADNEDNEGHIQLMLKNTGDEPIELKGRIAQGIFVKYGVTDDDTADADRVGGTGSTGN